MATVCRGLWHLAGEFEKPDALPTIAGDFDHRTARVFMSGKSGQ
jgi:hypothetical protein